MSGDVIFDFARAERIGLSEAVFCAGKTPQQIAAILQSARERDASLLLTRLDSEKFEALPAELKAAIEWCPLSQCAFFGEVPPVSSTGDIAIVAAGTSDAPAAREAERTLRHAGVEASVFIDVGVAGLWRLMDRIEEIRRFPVVVAVAGMDAALASVLGGLYSGSLICVPTSVGYGAAEEGRTALNAMLASCAPGLLVTNIDNGYGAACAALRIIKLKNYR
ncbi:MULTISPECIES: nickel pincer cofactor biosynthesis protein LarB [Rhizobium]|uniref:nickel pincer cofactor biosynthesis protein LarB n=1 Tax=Rhizobium TaxID=379 RepID=UPI0014413CA3|nr:MULTISPECIES: nickel pincer cofactor biosynthesis protein LarB [Rhizobium]MBY3134411.1 nickel pincer cofactor biosynthesis protein LarB [Rhizobium laguerreae]MBY3157468.1 nickel pincer cofactor biosynthesis protein LarB [Rhizobium laguerreae]MBY3169978.1 nickel pincer cofactor biosynthesis protein LarB [Rhizobium laguerreae]MBY3445945.1 nickel pincer cofactor biosynthesis protein LarB [Rhizobium laguerreae]MBY5558185.1 nickel pincer cofactor biosynthesis protein LarB [Rhizobium leguminosaru